MAKYIFISDMHLGAPEFNLDCYGVCELLKNNYDYLYLLGDIFDTWEMKLTKICENYKCVVDVFNAKSDKILFVVGNHDPDIVHLKKIFPDMLIVDGPYFTDINGYRTILMHGDDVDWVLSLYKLLISFPLDFVYYFCKTFFNYNFKHNIRSWYYKNKYDRFSYHIVAPLEKRILNNFRGKYDIFIMGHTHTPKIIATPLGRYVNCGSFIYKPSYIEYDTTTNRFNLVMI